MLKDKNTKPKKCKKGFTILEVIISFALIAIFLIPISNLVLSSVKINKMTENKQQAKAVLQETVENIKAIENLSTATINPLNNGVIVAKVIGEGGKLSYSLTGNINGFSIEGSITEKSLITDNEINKRNIDSAIYFDGDSISVSSSASTIETAISKSSGSLDILGDEVYIEVMDTGAISIIYGSSKNKIHISTPVNGALLLYIKDEIITGNKLKVNFENNVDTEKLKVYLYNNTKTSERDDIIISSLKGQIELITGMKNNDDSRNSKLYSVEIKAKKNNEIVEIMIFDLIK